MAEICREIHERVEETVERPIERWLEREEERCRRRRCNWWCLCCNKWFCWIVTIVVRVVVWVTVTIIKWITRVVCEVVSVVIDALAYIVGLVFSIPIIGRLIRQLWDIIIEALWRVASVPGLVLDAIGLDFRKRLRICIIILSDDSGPRATSVSLDPAIQSATNIFGNEANVDLIVDDIHTVQVPAPRINLDVGCNAEAYWEDLSIEGSYFEFTANQICFDGAGRRLVGFAAPVIVFVVRSVSGAAGCSLGLFSDYVTVEGPTGACLAHEIGHACSLWHVDGATNLMNPTCGRTQLAGWQRAIVRSSRHVTYF